MIGSTTLKKVGTKKAVGAPKPLRPDTARALAQAKLALEVHKSALRVGDNHKLERARMDLENARKDLEACNTQDKSIAAMKKALAKPTRVLR